MMKTLSRSEQLAASIADTLRRTTSMPGIKIEQILELENLLKEANQFLHELHPTTENYE